VQIEDICSELNMSLHALDACSRNRNRLLGACDAFCCAREL